MYNHILGEVLAWLVLTAVPLLAIWALVYRFTNVFARQLKGGYQMSFYKAVATEIEEFNRGIEENDKPLMRRSMQNLVTLARETGAPSKKVADDLVRKWLNDHREAMSDGA